MAEKEALAWIIELYDRMDPSKTNSKKFIKEWERMSKTAQKEWVAKLASGDEFVNFIKPIGSRPRLDRADLLKVGRELGHEWQQRVWNIGPSGERYLTPRTYFICHQPVRRPSQRLVKKMGIPKSNNIIDDFTDQVTGASKGSSLSNPQLQILRGQGINDSILELIKYRGGDLKGFVAMNQAIYSTGSVSLKEIEAQSGGVKSINMIRNILLAMNLDTTL